MSNNLSQVVQALKIIKLSLTLSHMVQLRYKNHKVINIKVNSLSLIIYNSNHTHKLKINSESNKSPVKRDVYRIFLWVRLLMSRMSLMLKEDLIINHILLNRLKLVFKITVKEEGRMSLNKLLSAKTLV
jgi:hypothetical protein